MKKQPYTALILPLFLVLTALLYQACLKAPFLGYDDPQYIVENTFLRRFSLEGFFNLFTQKVYDLYIPLTWLSYWIEINILKFSYTGMHATNLLLHAINAFLIFRCCEMLSFKKTSAFFVALLFLVHPQHVESVAWLSERKDVLYTFFYIGALMQYLKYTRTRIKRYYVVSFILFVLACLAKPMAVSFPFFLIAIEYFLHQKKAIQSHINKLPFIAIALLFSLIALYFMPLMPSENISAQYGLWDMCVLPFYQMGFYIVKALLPIPLCAVYAVPDFSKNVFSYGYALLFLALTLYVWIQKNKVLQAAWLCFVVILLPVLQFVPNANAVVADRYAYVSSSVVFILLVLAIEKNISSQKSKTVLSALAFLFFSLLCYQRCKIWTNDQTLFSDVLSKNPYSHTAYTNLGMYYLKNNQAQPALNNLQQAASLNPKSALILTNYAWALAINGQTEAALPILFQSLDEAPLYFKTWNNLGVVLGIKGFLHAGLKSLLFAQKLSPESADLYYNIAITYGRLGQIQVALSYYQKAAQKGLPQAQQFLSSKNISW
ncbi:MAG: tetratricopeptide repeat protein [Bacteroidetes bacterium]|nr:tetratricopeptide repeat protein [Bacteroidota bacterium]